MERDGFECCECGDKETTLNVHHSYYTKGAKPWEYPDESLKCLCEKCHQSRHNSLSELKLIAGTLPSWLLSTVVGYAKMTQLDGGITSKIRIENPAEAWIVCWLRGVDPGALCAHLAANAQTITSDTLNRMATEHPYHSSEKRPT